MVKFSEWLDGELNKKQWTRAELSRRAHISQPALSLIYSGQRNVGPDVAEAIANALSLPPDLVFQKADLLPSVPQKTEQADELAHLASLLGDDDLQEVIEYAKMRLKRKEESKLHKQKSSRGLRPARTALPDNRT